jgi:hypothetical protein
VVSAHPRVSALRGLLAAALALLVAACGSLLGLEDRQLDGDYPAGGYEGCRDRQCSDCSLDYHQCRCDGGTTDLCYRNRAANDDGTGFAGCDWSAEGTCKQCPTEFTLCMCQNKGQAVRCGNPEDDPVQRCREFFGAADLCAQCVCSQCGNEIAGCLEDAGCSALLECMIAEECTFKPGASDSCFGGGPCTDAQEEYGGPSGRAMTLLRNTHSCIDGPASTCECGMDPNDCCTGDNPCNLATNARCDCPSELWDSLDCSGNCCTPTNSCGVDNNQICECPDQPWDQNDCQNGNGTRCGSTLCYSTNVPFASAQVGACCPASNPDGCGLELGVALSTWPGDACAETNAPGLESDECPPGEPLRIPGQPVSPDLGGCCTPTGECGVMVNTGGFVPLGCHVNYPTLGSKPASCDPDGVVCDVDCNNCPSCESQCRCKIERYGFRYADFGKECSDACADCAAGETMCSGCSDDFGDCMCGSTSSDPNCCRQQVSQPVCSPFDAGSCGGGVSTSRCEECSTGCDSCVCDKCPNEWAQCQGDAGCMAIWACMQETDCRLCYTSSSCQDVIDDHGGPNGMALAKAGQVLNCSRLSFAMCGAAPANCPDACLPPDCQCGDCMSRCLCQTDGATEQCELQCKGGCSPEAGCLCGGAVIADCVCNGGTKAECEGMLGTACEQQYTCLDNCLCNGTSLDICSAEQCRNAEMRCGSATCYGREFYDSRGFNWLAPGCCPTSGADTCGYDLGALGSGLDGCVEVLRLGGENTQCPSHPPVIPWSGSDLPGCCSSGMCGYLDEQFAALGCMNASVFGDTGDGC